MQRPIQKDAEAKASRAAVEAVSVIKPAPAGILSATTAESFGTSWVDPDPPPIPERILRQVEPETSTRLGRFKIEFARQWRRRYRKQYSVYAVAGVMAVVLTLLLWPRNDFSDADAARWNRLCNAYATWFNPFLERLTPDDRLAIREVGLDTVLVELDNGRKAYDPLVIAGIPTTSVPRDQLRPFLLQLGEQPTSLAKRIEGVTAAFGAMAGLDRVVTSFERWEPAVQLAEQLPQLEAHGWAGPARELREALADLPPKVETPVAPSLRRIAEANDLSAQVITALHGLKTELPLLDRTSDPVVSGFRAVVAELDGHADFNDTQSPPREQLERLVARLKPLEAFGHRLATVIKDGTWARVDHDQFRQQGKAYALLAEQNGHVTDDVLRLWLEEMPRFHKVQDDWREAWAGTQRERLRDIEDRLALLRGAQHPSAKPMSARWHKLDERIALLLETPFVAGSSAAIDINRQEIETELRDLDAAVKQVLDQVNAAAVP